MSSVTRLTWPLTDQLTFTHWFTRTDCGRGREVVDDGRAGAGLTEILIVRTWTSLFVQHDAEIVVHRLRRKFSRLADARHAVIPPVLPFVKEEHGLDIAGTTIGTTPIDRQ